MRLIFPNIFEHFQRPLMFSNIVEHLRRPFRRSESEDLNQKIFELFELGMKTSKTSEILDDRLKSLEIALWFCWVLLGLLEVLLEVSLESR